MTYKKRFFAYFAVMVLFNMAASFAHPVTPTIIQDPAGAANFHCGMRGSSAQKVVGASGSGGAGGAGGARPPGPCVMAAAAGPSPTGRCAWCGGGPPAPARSLPAPGPVMSSVRPSAQPRGAAPLGPPALGAPVPGGETRN